MANKPLKPRGRNSQEPRSDSPPPPGLDASNNQRRRLTLELPTEGFKAWKRGNRESKEAFR